MEQRKLMKSKREIQIVIRKAGPGILKYSEIMRLYKKVNVSKSLEFQRKFNHFYRISHRPPAWYETYYAYMQKTKHKRIKFSNVLFYLKKRLGSFEASFSSKLLATRFPSRPIWDQHVLRNLGIQAPNRNVKNRAEKIVCTYKKIENWYRDKILSREGKMIINIYNEEYPDFPISDVKKIDFFLWQNRNHRLE